MDGCAGGPKQLPLAGKFFSRLPPWGGLPGKGDPHPCFCGVNQEEFTNKSEGSLSQAHILKIMLISILQWLGSVQAHQDLSLGEIGQ